MFVEDMLENLDQARRCVLECRHPGMGDGSIRWDMDSGSIGHLRSHSLRQSCSWPVTRLRQAPVRAPLRENKAAPLTGLTVNLFEQLLHKVTRSCRQRYSGKFEDISQR